MAFFSTSTYGSYAEQKAEQLRRLREEEELRRQREQEAMNSTVDEEIPAEKAKTPEKAKWDDIGRTFDAFAVDYENVEIDGLAFTKLGDGNNHNKLSPEEFDIEVEKLQAQQYENPGAKYMSGMGRLYGVNEKGEKWYAGGKKKEENSDELRNLAYSTNPNIARLGATQGTVGRTPEQDNTQELRPWQTIPRPSTQTTQTQMNLLKYEAGAELLAAKKRAQENAKAQVGREAYYNEQGKHYLDKEFETTYIKDVPDSQFSVPNYDKELNYLGNKLIATDMYLGKISKMRSDGSIEILTSTKDYNTTKQKIDWLKRKVDSIKNDPAYFDANNNVKYTALKELQAKFDNRMYYDIAQQQTPPKDFLTNTPIFGNGNLNDNGCGLISSLTAIKEVTGKADVFDAYNYFDQPQNNFAGSKGINPRAVVGYLKENGLKGEFSRGYNSFQPDSKYIALYCNGEVFRNWHYQYLETDSAGKVQSYNNKTDLPANPSQTDIETFREDNKINPYLPYMKIRLTKR